MQDNACPSMLIGVLLCTLVPTVGCLGVANLGSQEEQENSSNIPNEPTGNTSTSTDSNNTSPDNTPQPTAGMNYWSSQCQSCHGNFEAGSILSTGNNNGDYRLDVRAAMTRHGDNLESYISSNMPTADPSLCVGDCGQQTGQYIRSVASQSQAPTSTDCSAASITYGVRELKLLSSTEYQHALEDLLGVSDDFGTKISNNNSYRGGFVNMTGRALSGTSLDLYIKNAESIAEWAVTNQRPFECTDISVCSQRFVDQFLFLAFRGQVTDEQKSAYRTLFETYGIDGMRLALEAVLTSPYFLYRIEAGVDLQTAQTRGYYNQTAPTTDSTTPSVPGTNPTETLLAANFPPGSTGRLEGDVWGLFENGQVRFAFANPLTNPSIIEVQARGSNHNNLWPELTLRVGENIVGVQTVNSQQLSTYSFEVQGTTGIDWIQIEFRNDSGVPPYASGQDVNLFIAQVSLYSGNNINSEQPQPAPPVESPPESSSTENLLSGIDTNAFVLSPYEFASVLSFNLTGAPPSEALLREAPYLRTQDQIRTLIARLIDSPRGRQHFSNFVAEWFELGAIENASRPDVPEFNAQVKSSMIKEVQEHFAHIFYDDTAPFSEFFDGNYTFLNKTLADFYGISGNFSNNTFTKTNVDRRGGPIASGAFMTINAHVERTAPILRAVHTRQTALCHYIDPPNAPIAGNNIDEQRAAAQSRVAQQEQAAGLLSSRDFYFLYTDGIDACAGCHAKIINPMFGMEDFDKVGRLRPLATNDSVTETLASGQTEVSITGTLHGVASTSDSTTIQFSGAKDLSNKIAQTEAVQTCLARKGFRFLTGLTYVDRDLDTANQESITANQRQTYSCAASRMLSAFQTKQPKPKIYVY